MAVEPDLRVVAEFGNQSLDADGDVLEDERTRGVDDVDALAAGVGMMRACLAMTSGGWLWLIIRKPTVSSPRSRARPKC